MNGFLKSCLHFIVLSNRVCIERVPFSRREYRANRVVVPSRNNETRYAESGLLFRYAISDRYSPFSRFPIAEIVAPQCVHDFSWPHPPFVFPHFPIHSINIASISEKSLSGYAC